MFRASRSFLRIAHRTSLAGPAQKLPQLQASKLLPITQRVRFASKSDDPPPPPENQQIDRDHEKKIAEKKLKSDPSKVSSTSTIAHAGFDFGPSQPVMPSGKPSDNPEVQSGLKHDLSIVRDTFRLDSVPRESYLLGLAGTLPYVGTSLSTMFLAWDLTKDVPSGNAFYDAVLVDHETAQYLLTLIEPVQLGYGAVIISFLGAIHWGLEYAEKAPQRDRTRFRYGMGLASSIIAWPTLFMPLEYALTTQFMAFIALYFADARAAARGWAPYWYGTYRFLLTAMVGIAIFISLVGRSKINQSKKVNESSFTKSGIADHRTDWAKLEAEEREKLRKEREEQAKKHAEEEAKKKKEAKKSKGKKGKEDAKAADDGDEGDEGSDDGEKGEEKKEKKEKKPKKKESGKSDDVDESQDEGKDDEGESNDGEESDDESEGDDKKSEDKQDDDKKSEDKQDDDKEGDDEKQSEDGDEDKDDNKDGDQQGAEKDNKKGTKKDLTQKESKKTTKTKDPNENSEDTGKEDKDGGDDKQNDEKKEDDDNKQDDDEDKKQDEGKDDKQNEGEDKEDGEQGDDAKEDKDGGDDSKDKKKDKKKK